MMLSFNTLAALAMENFRLAVPGRQKKKFLFWSFGRDCGLFIHSKWHGEGFQTWVLFQVGSGFMVAFLRAWNRLKKWTSLETPACLARLKGGNSFILLLEALLRYGLSKISISFGLLCCCMFHYSHMATVRCEMYGAVLQKQVEGGRKERRKS